LVVDDEQAVASWAQLVVAEHDRRAAPPGGRIRRAIALPRWGATIFIRKVREIGFRSALRLAFDVATARWKARR
jgi:hypothetical protein